MLPETFLMWMRQAYFIKFFRTKCRASKGKIFMGGKQSKLRLTVLLFINSDGTEKLQPLLIGKFQNPQFFKNIKIISTKFATNSKSWMTSNISENEVLALDVKVGYRNQNILQFLHCCPAHSFNIVTYSGFSIHDGTLLHSKKSIHYS
jgi:hypothetical protein